MIWNAVRAEILPRWRSEYPGTRPWGWWQWESPEPRRPVEGGLVESEPAYLDRLNLLTHPERRQLTPADFEPVVPLDDQDDDQDDEALGEPGRDIGDDDARAGDGAALGRHQRAFVTGALARARRWRQRAEQVWRVRRRAVIASPQITQRVV